MNARISFGWRRLVVVLTILACLLPTRLSFAQTNFPTTGVILRDANLRAGAGTNSAIVGTGRTGQQVVVSETNSDATWYHLSTGEWIAAFLVELPGTSAIPGAPNIAIQEVFYDGDVPNVESDEYAVIVNNGTQPANLQRWQLSAGTLDQVFTFPDISLQSGQTCRIYTNEIHTDSCGLSFGRADALWNNKGDCGYLYDPSGSHISTYCYGDIADGETYTSGAITPSGTTAKRSANLRGGPGTNFPVVGGIQSGQALTIVSKNAAGDWYQLSDGQWIAAFLVSDEPSELVTVAQPTPTPLPAPAQVEAPTPTPIPQVVAPAAPARDPRSGQRRGATCRDGTTSGATGRGACSHHGGVSQWLYY